MQKILKRAIVLLSALGMGSSVWPVEFSTDFYYHQGEPVLLMRSMHQIALTFTPTLSNSELTTKLDRIQSELIVDKRMYDRVCVIDLDPSLDISRVEKVKKTFQADHEILQSCETFQLQNQTIIANGNLIVAFQQKLSSEELKSFCQQLQIVPQNQNQNPGQRRILFQLNPGDSRDILDLANQIRQDSRVRYAEPDWICLTCGPLATIPNDPYLPQQYDLMQSSDKDIDVEEAWDIETGNSSIIIAIIDSGVELDHEDLNIWTNNGELAGNQIDDDNDGYVDDIHGWDFVPQNGDNDPADGLNHGTPVAGIAAAKTNNGIGIAGVCWNARIMPLKIIDDTGIMVSSSRIAEAIDYSVANGADVLNLSWITVPSNSITEALENAKNFGRGGKGCVVVCGAGNEPVCAPGVHYPASLSLAIAVSGSLPNDAQSGCHDSTLDVLAPFSVNVTLYNNGGYSTNPFIGTSASTPHVSGLAGLLLSKTPQLSANQVQAIIEFSSKDQLGWLDDFPGRDERYGYGRINAHNALLLVGDDYFELCHTELATSALFDQFGNFIIKDKINEYATDQEMAVAPNTMWHLKNVYGQVVANLKTDGLLCIKSAFSENESNLNGISQVLQRVIFLNQPVAVFDQTGNLRITGQAFMEVILTAKAAREIDYF